MDVSLFETCDPGPGLKSLILFRIWVVRLWKYFTIIFKHKYHLSTLLWRTNNTDFYQWALFLINLSALNGSCLDTACLAPGTLRRPHESHFKDSSPKN